MDVLVDTTKPLVDPAKKTITGAEAARMAMDEALGLDPRVLVFGEDVADPEGGGILKATQGLSSKYGELRVRSTPIAEQAIVGAAVGAAIAGMLPVCEIMLMNFTTVAMDQIVNHAAKIRFMSGGQTAVPLTLRTMTGVGRGTGGQHGDMVEAWFAHTAGLKVVIPSSQAEWKGLLLSSIFDDDPCIFVENIQMTVGSGPAPSPGLRIPLGKANVLREGSDVTVISYGRPIADCLAVAEAFAGEGVSVEVVDLRTIVPLDRETFLNSVAKTKRAVVVHEAVRSFGVGAEISAQITEHLFSELKAPVQRVASHDSPIPYSKPLETAFAWSQDDIVQAIRKTLG